MVAPALSCPKSQSSVLPATSAGQSVATFVGAGAVLVAENSVQVRPPSFGSTSSSVTMFAVELPVFVITIVKVPGVPAAMVPSTPAASGVLAMVSAGGGQVTLILPSSVTGVTPVAAATASPVVGAPGVPLSIERSGLGPWQWCARDMFPEFRTTVIVAPALGCPKSQSRVFPATSARQERAHARRGGCRPGRREQRPGEATVVREHVVERDDVRRRVARVRDHDREVAGRAGGDGAGSAGAARGLRDGERRRRAGDVDLAVVGHRGDARGSGRGVARRGGARGGRCRGERSGLGPWQWCARDVFPEVTTTVIVAPALSCPKSQGSSVFRRRAPRRARPRSSGRAPSWSPRSASR